MEAKVARKSQEEQWSCSSDAEASRSVTFSSSNLPPMIPGHRRAQSEVVGVGQRPANGFTTLKSQMQDTWRWGSTYREEKHRVSFNPEVLAVQKRQWYQLQSKSMVLNLDAFQSTLSFHFRIFSAVGPLAYLFELTTTSNVLSLCIVTFY